MRIRTIRTEALFGIFNHIISLNLNDRITIIHGPNGYGKTAVLRLVSDIFTSRHAALRQLPFDRIVLEFDDGSELTVLKQVRPEERRSTIVYEYPPNEPFNLSEHTDFEEWASVLDRHVPYVTRVRADTWRHDKTGELLSLEDMEGRFPEYIPRGALTAHFPDWLVQLRDSLDVHFIRATRLETARVTERSVRRRRSASLSVVGNYAVTVHQNQSRWWS